MPVKPLPGGPDRTPHTVASSQAESMQPPMGPASTYRIYSKAQRRDHVQGSYQKPAESGQPSAPSAPRKPQVHGSR